MMIDAHLTKHIQCPKCAKIGKDNGHNNLGVYSDGHMWCFSCHYFVSGNKIEGYKARVARVQKDTQPERPILGIPIDSNSDIPTEASEWLFQYELNNNTLIKHHILWSESREMLIFPYFIQDTLVAWQGRYFGTNPKIGKWHTKGDVEKIVYVLGRKSKTIVLVEDIVSAIKVARIATVSPIFGSHISLLKLKTLGIFYDKIIIWLDPDKQKDAIKFAEKGQLMGLETRVVLSNKDPKEHSMDEIVEYLKC